MFQKSVGVWCACSLFVILQVEKKLLDEIAKKFFLIQEKNYSIFELLLSGVIWLKTLFQLIETKNYVSGVGTDFKENMNL